MGWVQYIFHDSVVFVALHIGLIALVVYAIWGERKMKSDIASVKRASKSWDYFNLAYGMLSVVVIQIISISEFGKGCKVLISIFDLGLLFYLAFFNSWFRNKTIGVISASQIKEE